jgi:hypothetical protein
MKWHIFFLKQAFKIIFFIIITWTVIQVHIQRIYVPQSGKLQPSSQISDSTEKSFHGKHSSLFNTNICIYLRIQRDVFQSWAMFEKSCDGRQI